MFQNGKNQIILVKRKSQGQQLASAGPEMKRG